MRISVSIYPTFDNVAFGDTRHATSARECPELVQILVNWMYLGRSAPGIPKWAAVANHSREVSGCPWSALSPQAAVLLEKMVVPPRSESCFLRIRGVILRIGLGVLVPLRFWLLCSLDTFLDCL